MSLESDVICESQTFHIRRRHLVSTCLLFERNPALLLDPYRVRSQVNIVNFREFVRAIEGQKIDINPRNREDINKLIKEFEFEPPGSAPAPPKPAGPPAVPLRERKFPAIVSPIQGIIDHLTKRYGANVVIAGRVLVTASSVYTDAAFSTPKNVADINFDSAFSTNDEPDSWICWDFKEKRVLPTDYSIGSAAKGMVQHFNLRRWVIEGSVTGADWIVLDKQDENNELTAKPVTRTYPLKCTQQLQFVRLRQTGKNHNGGDNLAISFFEIFGSLFE
jgi:hypothetical protein